MCVIRKTILRYLGCVLFLEEQMKYYFYSLDLIRFQRRSLGIFSVLLYLAQDWKATHFAPFEMFGFVVHLNTLFITSVNLFQL